MTVEFFEKEIWNLDNMVVTVAAVKGTRPDGEGQSYRVRGYFSRTPGDFGTLGTARLVKAVHTCDYLPNTPGFRMQETYQFEPNSLRGDAGSMQMICGMIGHALICERRINECAVGLPECYEFKPSTGMNFDGIPSI